MTFEKTLIISDIITLIFILIACNCLSMQKGNDNGRESVGKNYSMKRSRKNSENLRTFHSASPWLKYYTVYFLPFIHLFAPFLSLYLSLFSISIFLSHLIYINCLRFFFLPLCPVRSELCVLYINAIWNACGNLKLQFESWRKVS